MGEKETASSAAESGRAAHELTHTAQQAGGGAAGITNAPETTWPTSAAGGAARATWSTSNSEGRTEGGIQHEDSWDHGAARVRGGDAEGIAVSDPGVPARANPPKAP
jgi:hypothetical protein